MSVSMFLSLCTCAVSVYIVFLCVGYCQFAVFLCSYSWEGIDEIHKYERDYFARSKLFQ